MNSEFDWGNDESVVTTPVRGVAAHWNDDGDVVIRVQVDDPEHPAHDDAIVIPLNSLNGLVARLSVMRDERAVQDKKQ